MDWTLVLWTALSWMFSGGILYLVYHFGYNTAAEDGVKWKSWRTVALLVGFVISLAFFGSGYPEQGYAGMPALSWHVNSDEISRFLGVFIIVVVTYCAGFVDNRLRHAR
jgi:hypothetical protein